MRRGHFHVPPAIPHWDESARVPRKHIAALITRTNCVEYSSQGSGFALPHGPHSSSLHPCLARAALQNGHFRRGELKCSPKDTPAQNQVLCTGGRLRFLSRATIVPVSKRIGWGCH